MDHKNLLLALVNGLKLHRPHWKDQLTISLVNNKIMMGDYEMDRIPLDLELMDDRPENPHSVGSFPWAVFEVVERGETCAKGNSRMLLGDFIRNAKSWTAQDICFTEWKLVPQTLEQSMKNVIKSRSFNLATVNVSAVRPAATWWD